MVRTQLQIDEDTYEALRQTAHEQRKSMSAVARRILRERLIGESPCEAPLKEKFRFIGMGKSGRDDLSVKHDEALAEDFG